MGVSASQIERVRKLLRRASSSNPHEAASARDIADELMAKHGLSADDVAEDVIEVAESRREDMLRDELARLIAKSHRCSVLANRRGELAFRGGQGVVQKALALYRRLALEADVRSQMSTAGDPPEAAREAWRICWWLGFVSAVGDRLKSGRRRGGGRVEVPPQESMPAPVAACAEALEELRSDLDGEVDDVEAVLGRLLERSFESGREAGDGADLRTSIVGLLR